MKADSIVEALMRRDNPLSHASKDELRTLGKNLPILCWISQPDAPATWFNPEWLDFVGRTERTMRDWAYQDFHHPDYIAGVVTRRFTATCAGKIWEDVFPLLGRDNKFHWLLSRAVPILDADGQLNCYFGFHIDVTDKIKHPPLRPIE